MLSRSLTSCLIIPPTNDFVQVINSICSLKSSAHTARSSAEVIAVYGSCVLQARWALYSRSRAGVCSA